MHGPMIIKKKFVCDCYKPWNLVQHFFGGLDYKCHKIMCLAVEYLVIGVNSNYSFSSAAINGSLNKTLYESILYPCSLPTVLNLDWEVQQPI